MSLGALVKYFQHKLGNYDKQSCDQSVEQRILQEMDKGTPHEEKKGNNLFIDVDLVRGSVFSKSKTRHRWIQVVMWGVLRTAFAPLYWDYWREHTSFRMAAYVMFHFLVQLIQAICFLLIDPETSKSTQDDVFVPCLLAVLLGILHAHITAAHGSIGSSVLKQSDKEFNHLTTHSSSSRLEPDSRSFQPVATQSTGPISNVSDQERAFPINSRDSDPQSSQRLSSGPLGNRRGSRETNLMTSIGRQDSSPSRMIVRHRRPNMSHAPIEPEGLSSDADEEEAEDEFENRCNGCPALGVPESTGLNDRHAVPWSRSATRFRGSTTNRTKLPASRLKTASCRHGSGHTAGEDEKFSVHVTERTEIPVESEYHKQSQSLSKPSTPADLFSGLFRLNPWRSTSDTSLLCPIQDHKSDGEASETETPSDQPAQSTAHTSHGSEHAASGLARPQWTPNTDSVSQPLFISTEQCSSSGPPSNSRDTGLQSVTRFDVQPLVCPRLNFVKPDRISTEPVNVEAASLETIIPLNESPHKPTLIWTSNSACADHFSNTEEPPLESPLSTPVCTVFTDSEEAVRRPRIRSWSIGFPVDQYQFCGINSSVVPSFCYGSSLGLSRTMLSILSDEHQRCCFWGIGSLGRMVNISRHFSSPTGKPIALGWDSVGRDFSSMQALRATSAQCGTVTNAVGSSQAPLHSHHHHRIGRAFVSGLSSAQSTSSSNGSQPEHTNDRSGLHRDLESVHGVGAELCANPKASWNGNMEDLESTKSDLRSVDTKSEFGRIEQTMNESQVHTHRNAVAIETPPHPNSHSKLEHNFLLTKKTSRNHEQDEDDKSFDSQCEIPNESEPLNCVASEDTFTTRSRQRANFLQLFLRRAYNHRQQIRALNAAHLSSDALDESTARVHRTNQPAANVTHNGGTFFRLYDTFTKKDELGRLEPPSFRRRFPTGLRQSAVLTPQSKLHVNSLGSPTTGMMNKWANIYAKNLERKVSFGTRDRRIKGQTASETEYDRINSDVGSDVDSSSGPEEDAEHLTHLTKCDHLTVSIPSDPRTPPGISPVESGTISTPPHSPGATSTVSANSPSRTTRPGVFFRDASNVWTREPTVRIQAPHSPAHWSHGSDEMRLPADRSRSNAVELTPGVGILTGPTSCSPVETAAAEPGFDGPLSVGLKPADRTEFLAEKYSYRHPAREGVSKTWAQLPSGANDTIACYVWEGDKSAKCNLTMLDVGWNVIRAVERQGVSSDYILVACASSILLPLLSVFYHWNRFYPTNGTSTQLNVDTRNITVAIVPQSDFSDPLTNVSRWILWLNDSPLADSLIAMQFQVLLRLSSKILMFFGQPFYWILDSIDGAGLVSEQASLGIVLWNLLTGRWIGNWLMSPDLPGRMVIFLGVLLRFNMFSTVFLLLCIAERTFQQRLLYAKYFFSLTSGRRARKYHVPQFRLNKLRHIKCWLTLRSYLKKRGPQRSVENIIVASFYVVFVFGLALGSQFISKKNDQTFSRLINLDMMGLTLGIALFQHRFLVLGTKITKKYRNLSIIITEQINLYLSIEKKPYKKDDFLATFQVLRLVEGLLKEVDGPFRICGWTVNPLVYNVFKLVLLSCFSTILSDAIGFKLKLHKLKLNAANW